MFLVQGRKPGDYLKALLVDFTRKVDGGEDNELFTQFDRSGLRGLLLEFNAVDALQIRGFTERNTSREVRDTINQFISRSPLRRFSMDKSRYIPCIFKTLEALPTTLQSLVLDGVSVFPVQDDGDMEVKASALQQAFSLTDRLEIRNCDETLEGILVAYSEGSNISKGLKSVAYETNLPSDQPLLPSILKQSTKVESLELTYDRTYPGTCKI